MLALILPLVISQAQVVNGAPLKNPDVGLHVVEQKPVSDSGRLEFTLYPAVPQLNGLYTQHVGTMGQLTWHLREHFGLTLSGGGNWHNQESRLNGELLNKARIEAQSAASLLWTWTAMAGVEVAPFYGKFALFDSGLAQFSVVINASAGVGGTRHLLKPETSTAATYGDTGVRFMGAVGAGFRLTLGQHVAIRLKVRDVVYTARVDQVNGCSERDFPRDFTFGNPIQPVTSTCKETALSPSDAALARGLIKERSSEVLNSLGAWAGVSFLY